MSKNFSQGVEIVIENFTNPAVDQFVVHTSGSTGKPKSIRLNKKHMKASAEMTLQFLTIGENDSCLLCMSPSHIGGIMMVVRAIVGNLRLTEVQPQARPLQGVDGDFDFVAMVPYQVEASLKDLHRIKKLIIGGGPISSALEKQLKGLPNEIYHTFGMTETISHIAMRRVNGKDSEVFHTLPGIRVSTDSRNCLKIDAPMLGVSDLQTNDIVELINSSSFIWKGRIDNVVNSAGVKLHPELIERKIENFPYPFFLTGIPDEKFGQKLIMIIEASSLPSQSQIEWHLKALHKYELPKAYFHIAKFSRTASGKLDRLATLNQMQLV